MMRRDECFRKIAEHRGGAIVVAAYTSAFEWMAIDPSPLNFVSVGAMGQASSHALGLAIGLPDRRIVVLDGDGSLLMNLGSLVTIAEAGPENLVHFVVENGTYEANGGHPIPGSGRVDFAGFARGAGYPKSTPSTGSIGSRRCCPNSSPPRDRFSAASKSRPARRPNTTTP